MKECRESLCGISPPLLTPFHNNEVDVDAYKRLLTHVLDGGVDALFPCGTTGEAASLTLDERKQLVRAAVEASPSHVPVFAGGTVTSVEGTRGWIGDVAAVGGDGVLLSMPFFHNANDPDGYRQFFEGVLADSPIPVLLYNIPDFVGEPIPPSVVETIASHDAVLGMKDSSGDFAYGLTIQDRTPDDFIMLQGIDELLLPALRMGFDGGVNAGVNVFPKQYRDVVDEPFSQSAFRIHREVVRPFFQFCLDQGFATGTKAVAVAAGLLHRSDVRPPLVAVDPAEATATLSDSVDI